MLRKFTFLKGKLWERSGGDRNVMAPISFRFVLWSPALSEQRFEDLSTALSFQQGIHKAETQRIVKRFEGTLF